MCSAMQFALAPSQSRSQVLERLDDDRVLKRLQAFGRTYHAVILAPATSNTVAKCVVGGRLPAIVFACDTAPELETEAR